MRKILFLLLGLTIAVSASADVKTLRERRSEKRVWTEHIVHQHLTPLQAWASKCAGKKAAIPKDKSLRLVDEIPEGLDILTLSRTGGYAVYTDADHNLHSEAQDPDCTVLLAQADDGVTVYFKNLLYKTNEVMNDYWVVGYFDPGKMEFRIPIGTTIAEFKDYDLYLDMGAITQDENNQVVYVPDSEPAEEIVYRLDPEANTLSLAYSKETPPYDGYNATGLCCRRTDNDAWDGFMEWETVLTLSLPEPPTIITEQPEGELVTYEHSSFRLNNGGSPLFYNAPVDIVYAPDGETVYIKGLMNPSIPAWLIGTISGGKIHVPLGQYILYNANSGSGALISWGTSTLVGTDESGNPYYEFTPDPTVTEFTFTIDGDNLIMDNTTGGNQGDGAIGLATVSDDGSPFFIMEFNTVLSSFVEPTLILDQPEGELVTYNRRGFTLYDAEIYNQGGQARIVYAPDGETVYIQDIVSDCKAAAWVRGTIENGKIHVPLNQYIDWDPEYHYGIMLAFGQLCYNQEYDTYYLGIDTSVSEATFTINGDIISLDNTSLGPNGASVGSTGLATVWSDDPTDFLQFDVNTKFILPPTIIYDQPDGQLLTYPRIVQGYAFYDNQMMSNYSSDFNVVVTDDGQTVYVENPVSIFGASTWVQGTLNNNKITVPLGQYVYNDTDFGGMILAWGTLTRDADGYHFEYDPTVTEVTYTIDGNGNVTIDNSTAGELGNGARGLAIIQDDYSTCICIEWNMPEFTAPIYAQPEGYYRKYFRTLQPRGYHFRDEYYENGIAEFVFSQTDNTVYIKGIIRYVDTWVMGTISGNKIHVPLGQYIYDDGNYYGKLRWLRATSPNGYDEQSEVDYSVTEVTFTIDGDKIIMDQDNYWDEPYYRQNGLGECICNSSGIITNVMNMQLEVEFIPYFEPGIIEDTPEGELVTYLRRGVTIKHQYELRGDNRGSYPEIWPHELNQQGGEAYVVYAPDGRTVYLYEPVQCRTNLHDPRFTWVMGTLSEDGHKIIVPLDQYVTWDPTTNVAERLAWGTSGYRTDNNGDTEIYFVPDNSVMTVTYTIEDGCLRMDNSSGHDFVMEVSSNSWADGNTGLAITDQFMHWRGDLNWFTTYAGNHPAVPKDPVIEYWEDNGDENGNSALLTIIDAIDVDGYGISEEGLSYSIYTDRGKLFTFEASKYGLQEDVTEVTYDMWQDNYMLRPGCIYFFRTNAEGFEPFFNWRIGIQLHYTCNGVKQSSNIVYLEVFDKPNEPVTPGDANDDGMVTVGDISTLIDILLGQGTGNINELNADANGDGLITIADVAALIDILLEASNN
jgi:hypothetical protein